MLPTGSDKALRKLVMELAEATPDDIAAVLARLDARPCAMVQALLAAYTDVGDVFELEAPAAPIANTAGLSGWLAARTLGHAAEGEDYRMTPATREALRAIIAAKAPVSAAARGSSGRHLRLDGASA